MRISNDLNGCGSRGTHRQSGGAVRTWVLAVVACAVALVGVQCCAWENWQRTWRTEDVANYGRVRLALQDADVPQWFPETLDGLQVVSFVSHSFSDGPIVQLVVRCRSQSELDAIETRFRSLAVFECRNDHLYAAPGRPRVELFRNGEFEALPDSSVVLFRHLVGVNELHQLEAGSRWSGSGVIVDRERLEVVYWSNN